MDRLLGRLLARVGPVVDEVAMDSTGREPSDASAYYTARRGTRHKGYVKLSLVVSRGPRHDTCEAEEVMRRASAKGRPKRLYADKGYDAERVHRFCFETWKVRRYIPPVINRTDGGIGGRYRSRMRRKPNGTAGGGTPSRS